MPHTEVVAVAAVEPSFNTPSFRDQVTTTTMIDMYPVPLGVRVCVREREREGFTLIYRPVCSVSCSGSLCF